jgi:DNA topoisomerase-1
LKIPPAWTDVKYSPDPHANLLVVGKDSKGRRQAIYSKTFSATQAAAKFSRIAELDKKFSAIFKENWDNRKSREKAAAADCLLLIMTTGIRPGSEADTGAEKQAFGATTLLGKHVKVSGHDVSLHFVGKKGVELNIPVDDPETKKMLLKRKQLSGNNGRLFTVSEAHLLSYVSTLDGGGFKTKDFRTLLGTNIAMREVEATPAPKNEKEYKKAVVRVAKAVANKLGNTPVIALQSYINPVVFADWRVAA